MMPTAAVAVPAPRTWSARLAWLAVGLLWVAFAVGVGLGFGFLAAMGFWYVGLAAIAVIPAFVLIHRRPLVGVAIWLAVVPLVTVTASPALRQVYWLLHRAMPIGILVLIVATSALQISPRRLARLDRVEVFVGGFVLLGFASIALLSGDPVAQTILFYDRWIPAICLYLIVRLLEPSRHDLRWLVPVAVGILVVEAPIAIATLTIPAALPQEWIVLTRATGTFGDPDVLGTTMAFCGVVILWAGTTTIRPVLRAGSVLLFVVAMLMVFLTFSRANWLAGVLVVAGAAWIFRDRLGALVVAGPMLLVALTITGVLAGPLAFAEERLESQQAQESALARLPVAIAAVRMFEARPFTGWGYGNFDLYSRDFQAGVGNLVTPEKDHASHNLFLSLLAELGMFGVVTFLTPMGIWLLRTWRARDRMPMIDQRFAAGLWLVVLAFVVVNNFSVMKSPYGLGLWWLSLGLIATTVARYHVPAPSRFGPGSAREDDDG